MEEILKKLNDLVNYLSQKYLETKKLEEALANKELALNQRDADLTLRTAKCEVLESVGKAKRENEAKANELKEREKKLEALSKTNTDWLEQQKKEIAKERSFVSTEKKKIEDEKEMLKKEYVAFAEEKENYKINFAKELLSKA